MSTTDSPPDLSNILPDPDVIRAAIEAADKRARLLRLALQLQLHLTTADHLTGSTDRREAFRA